MMAQMDNGDMSACPFMGEQASFCKMTILEHIAFWQSLFALNLKFNLLILLIIYLVIERLIPKLDFRKNYLSLFVQNTYCQPLSYLVIIFSDGLLHPKIY